MEAIPPCIPGALREENALMGLLDHLFRHKSAIPENRAAPKSSASGEGVAGDGVEVEPQPAPPVARGLGAIAAAIGLQPERGMPEVFEVSLGDLLRRAPEKCVWPGRHDPARVLQVPSAEIADGISKGRAELPLARLIALAPDIFRWEPGESTDPRVRLPLQKLLQQIGSHALKSAHADHGSADVNRDASPGAGIETLTSGSGETSEPANPSPDACVVEVPVEGEIIRARLPSISWGDAVQHEGPPAAQQPAAPLGETILASPAAPVEAPVSAPASEIAPAVASQSSQEPEVSLASVPLQDADKSVTEPTLKPVELRGPSDATSFTTPGVVVLSGTAVSAQAEGMQANQILAPKVPLGPAATPSIILAPASAKAGGAAPPQPAAQRASTPSIAGVGQKADVAATQSTSGSEGSLDPAVIAAKVIALPAVHACVITSARGTVRAGQFPAGLDAESLRALAVEFGTYANARASRLNIGHVENITLHRGDCEIAVFVREGVCLSVVLDPGGFAAGVRERLVRAAKLLAGAP